MAHPDKTATTTDSKSRRAGLCFHIAARYFEPEISLWTETVFSGSPDAQPPMVNRVLTSPYLW
jgi:hypothetical protein